MLFLILTFGFFGNSYSQQDSLAKIKNMKYMLVGTWHLETLGKPPFRSGYYNIEDSTEKYTLIFYEDEKYLHTITKAGTVDTIDYGIWDIWYLPKGFYGDTIFTADGFYLKFNSVYADSNPYHLSRYPEKILNLTYSEFILHWECYCGMLRPDLTFSKEISSSSIGYVIYNGHYDWVFYNEGNHVKEQDRVKKENDSISEFLYGSWKSQRIPDFIDEIGGDVRTHLSHLKRKKLNKEHDRTCGYFIFNFYGIGEYSQQYIDPKNEENNWAIVGNWLVFSDSADSEMKYVYFCNSESDPIDDEENLLYKEYYLRNHHLELYMVSEDHLWFINPEGEMLCEFNYLTKIERR